MDQSSPFPSYFVQHPAVALRKQICLLNSHSRAFSSVQTEIVHRKQIDRHPCTRPYTQTHTHNRLTLPDSHTAYWAKQRDWLCVSNPFPTWGHSRLQWDKFWHACTDNKNPCFIALFYSWGTAAFETQLQDNSHHMWHADMRHTVRTVFCRHSKCVEEETPALHV